MSAFDFSARTRIVCGAGSVGQIGSLARSAGLRRALLVADPGMLRAGHVARVTTLLADGGIEALPFHDFDENPDTDMIERGRSTAAALQLQGSDDAAGIIALGGGSSMDTAKAINFVLTNGGTMADYRGYGNATRPLLPMLAVPTTSGTGSEVQSYAVIADAVTHVKMACGDPKAAFTIAVLDPELTLSQPARVTAAAGFDALSHAVESYVTTRRTAMSDMWAREAWRLIVTSYPLVLHAPDDVDARAGMQLGACFAGMAIEQSMLGATHACANPLTAAFGIAHGDAIAMLLPHVVRWNASAVADRYGELATIAQLTVGRQNAAETFAAHLEQLAGQAGLRRTLRDAGVTRGALPSLAHHAAAQWTGGFNPRPFDAAGALEIYECAH